ncbi:Zinc finger and BTB domain-containing protein 26 [Varanus komodoensis]|uniref:zinc finger and BTB domain-containing protein 26-like n=1 Tax=Varanus komodoensis TaxID=61221 RepID=UPI001CF7A5B3|nr:zinc finger and BTB domain-containing protein 26-like [Varanus komodoensis]KAF7242366.1 Zinc finger and BTB domain-containing protein 26 [Varanus komodoensis]
MAPACERLQFRFPGYGDGVLHRMDQLREQRRFCDVTVQVNELRVPGHRVVFAACSPFLRDQFLLNDSQEVSVSLFQSPEIGRQLLLSCYTGCLEVPIKELVNYLTAASFLQMGHVVERCAQAVSHYLVPKADALLREEHVEGSYPQQDGEQEEKQSSSPAGEADSEESKAEGPEFAPRGSHGPASPAISLSLINSAVEITRSYLQGCYDDETSNEGLPFPSAAPLPASQWRNYPLHRHRHGTAAAYRDWRTGGAAAAWKVPGLERPYRCPRCSCVFQQLGNFASHVQEHKLFLCLRCGKVFSQKSNLTRHIRVHTGFKPFQCPVCRKCFTQNATLQDHLNLHSGIKPHKCNYCEMHFTHKPGLRRHLKEMHGKSTVQNSHEEIEQVTIDFD